MILFTLDMVIKQHLKKTAAAYTVAVIFTAIFGFVYEYFSHNVWSSYMGLAFLIPAACFVFYILLKRLSVSGGRVKYGKLIGTGDDLFHCAAATLTVGSIMRGIIDIYGTTNHLLVWYAAAGVLLLITGTILIMLRK